MFGHIYKLVDIFCYRCNLLVQSVCYLSVHPRLLTSWQKRHSRRFQKIARTRTYERNLMNFKCAVFVSTDLMRRKNEYKRNKLKRNNKRRVLIDGNRHWTCMYSWVKLNYFGWGRDVNVKVQNNFRPSLDAVPYMNRIEFNELSSWVQRMD